VKPPSVQPFASRSNAAVLALLKGTTGPNDGPDKAVSGEVPPAVSGGSDALVDGSEEGAGEEPPLHRERGSGSSLQVDPSAHAEL
jgi:hypothetical protein